MQLEELQIANGLNIMEVCMITFSIKIWSCADIMIHNYGVFLPHFYNHCYSGMNTSRPTPAKVRSRKMLPLSRPYHGVRKYSIQWSKTLGANSWTNSPQKLIHILQFLPCFLSGQNLKHHVCQTLLHPWYYECAMFPKPKNWAKVLDYGNKLGWY